VRGKFAILDYRDLLPGNWALQIEKCVRTRGRRIDKHATDPGHLETGGKTGLHYRVVTTTDILLDCPFVADVFSEVATEVSQMFRTNVKPMLDSELGVNVNLLEGAAADYELHNDIVGTHSVVLFATTQAEGGALTIYTNGYPGPATRIQPVAGQCVVFANPIPHEVGALGTLASHRIVVTCSLLDAAMSGAEREAQLKGYADFLYGSQGHEEADRGLKDSGDHPLHSEVLPVHEKTHAFGT
jgi:hypothetical protein